MIALFRCLGRLDLVIVVNQVGIILMRVAAEEAVVAIEAASQRPAVIGAGCADLLGGSQMPFPDAVGVIAMLKQDLGEEAILERDRAVAAWIARRAFRDAGHRIRMMIASGDDARARRRTERRRVHVGVTAGRSWPAINIGRVDRRAVTAELSKTGVVDHDEEYIRRAFFRALRRGPCRLDSSIVRPMTPGMLNRVCIL